jgi:hypothetical protein
MKDKAETWRRDEVVLTCYFSSVLSKHDPEYGSVRLYIPSCRDLRHVPHICVVPARLKIFQVIPKVRVMVRPHMAQPKL